MKPDYAEAYYNRGNALLKLERFGDALVSYGKAIALKPDYADAYNKRGIALFMLERFGDALASYDKAIALQPNDAEAYCDRGIALFKLERFGDALVSYGKAIALRPDHARAYYNRGIALFELEHFRDVLASYDKAIALKPDHADAYHNRGLALLKLERFGDALASYNKAIALKPDHADALYNRGLLALLEGRYAEGWRDYERRWDIQRAPARKLVASWPFWKGEDLEDKRIIVYDEQGLGDVIQCSRFLMLLASRGARVTFLVRASLHRLFRAFTPSVCIVDESPADEFFHFQSPLMSLPGSFRTTPESIPVNVPYLCAEEPLVAHWQQRLGSQGLKIGVCWQGDPKNKIDLGRSIPLCCFRPLASVPGVRLISLQKNYGLDQLKAIPTDMRVETLGEDFDNGPDAFVDTAAVMSCLDLVITSDTSVAHLAGALGRPVWIALKHVPDWRWMLDRADSPWYPTMALYRQEVRDDWASVFLALADDLGKLQKRESRTTIAQILIPGSVGELFDRITILRIKVERIKDPGRLRNVNHELSLLLGVEAKCGPPGPEVLQLVSELRTINERLWSVEDQLRDCERQQDFGEEFIRLARAVYRTNDERAAVKKQINILCGSQIINEKSYGN